MASTSQPHATPYGVFLLLLIVVFQGVNISAPLIEVALFSTEFVVD
jgi:hypothetical protein